MSGLLVIPVNVVNVSYIEINLVSSGINDTACCVYVAGSMGCLLCRDESSGVVLRVQEPCADGSMCGWERDTTVDIFTNRKLTSPF